MKHKILQELRDDIKAFDRIIQRHPNEDNAWYSKACTLIKLGQEIDNKEYYDEALQYYNKAIELLPDNPLYLVDRAKLYLKIKESNLAIKDVEKALEFAKNSEGVTALYIRDTIKAIEKEISSATLPIEYYSEPLMQLNQSSNIVGAVINSKDDLENA